jgi:MinD-like ATPase involved in chromosome partitioning or flagellar assembly
MKIAVLNYTGTVGKTTIAAHLLAPRMNDAPVFAIESVNQTAEDLGIDVNKMRGDRFRDLFKKLLVLDDAIIDVGASNVEEFLNGMTRFEDSHLEIDCYIVPVTSGSKEQKETISAIDTLANLGIPPEKIRVVFNRVANEVGEEFSHVLNYAKKEKNCIADPEAAIYENELFDMLALKKLTIKAALEDTNDYKAMLRELGKEGDKKLAAHYTDMHAIKALSKSVNRHLDAVYAVVIN